MKILLTILLSISFVYLLNAQLPSFGTGPGGVGNARGTNGHAPNSMWFNGDEDSYFSTDGDSTTIQKWYDISGNNFVLETITGKPSNFVRSLNGGPQKSKDNYGKTTVDFGLSATKKSLYLPDPASEKAQIEGNKGLYLCVVMKRNEVNNEFKPILEKRFEQEPFTNRSWVFQTVVDYSFNSDEIMSTLNHGLDYTYFYNSRKILSTDSFYIVRMNYFYKAGVDSMVYFSTNNDSQTGSFVTFNQTINNGPSPMVVCSEGSMKLSEIIIYNSGLNRAQDAIIHNYLSRKFRINLSTISPANINETNFPYDGNIIGVGKYSNTRGYHLRSYSGGLGLEMDSATVLAGASSYLNHYLYAANNNSETVSFNGYYLNRFYFVRSVGSKSIKGSLYFMLDSLGLAVPTSASGYKLYYIPMGSSTFTNHDTVAVTPVLVGTALKFTLDNVKTGYYGLSFGNAIVGKYVVPKPKIDTKNIINTDYYKNEGQISITISGGSGHFKYQWSNNAVTSKNSNLGYGHYKVTVYDSILNEFLIDSFTVRALLEIFELDTLLCDSSSINFRGVRYPTNTDNKVFKISTTSLVDTLFRLRVNVFFYNMKPSICMVTIDSVSGKYLIIWERFSRNYIEKYTIYKSNANTYNYEPISDISFNQPSVYIDMASHPKFEQNFYKLTATNTCGEESDLYFSLSHKPFLLQYISSEGGVNLTWNNYEIDGNPITFQSYIIYRGSDSINMTPLKILSGNIHSYIDQDSVARTSKMYYQIAGVWPTSYNPSIIKSSSGSFSQSLSNIEDNRLKINSINVSNAELSNFSVYPNPTNGKTTITFLAQGNGTVKITLLNSQGVVVMPPVEYNYYNGNNYLTFEIPESIEDGVYFISIDRNGERRNSSVLLKR